MHFLIKITTFLIMLLCLGCCNINYCFASDIENLVLVKEIELEEEFCVSISNTYTENKCIQQADANENGDYVTFTLYQAFLQDENKENSLLKKYIDVYDGNGKFRCELSYINDLSAVLKMSGDMVYIIFRDTALVFDIVSREVKYYEIDSQLLYGEDGYKNIENGTEFKRGKWTYQLKRYQNLGYGKLIRSTDTESQILINIPRQSDYGYLLTIVCVSGATAFLIASRINKYKKKQKIQGKKFSVDGFYELDEKGRIKYPKAKRAKHK